MSFLYLEGIIFNIDHIITIEDNSKVSHHCVLRMSNRDEFFLGVSKESILEEIEKATK